MVLLCIIIVILLFLQLVVFHRYQDLLITTDTDNSVSKNWIQIPIPAFQLFVVVFNVKAEKASIQIQKACLYLKLSPYLFKGTISNSPERR